MAKYKISVDEETCIGCGACVATCPEHFDFHDTDKGSKAKPKKEETDDLECAKDAADVCPVNAIHITEDDKKIV